LRAKLEPLHDVGLAAVCILDSNTARLHSLHAGMSGQLVMDVGRQFTLSLPMPVGHQHRCRQEMLRCATSWCSVSASLVVMHIACSVLCLAEQLETQTNSVICAFTRKSSCCFQRVLANAILCPSVCPSVTLVDQ